MKKEKSQKNESIIIALLVLIIVILLVLVGLLATGTISYKPKEIPTEKTNVEVTEKMKNKAYVKGEELTLSDGSKWLVISNSNEDLDYVTAMAYKDFIEYLPEKDSTSINDEIFSDKKYDDTWYANSKIKEFLDSKVDSIPVLLKEVDGYKIRLIKVQEILDFDSNWTYNEEHDSYYYTGSNLNQYFKSVLTMTPSKCHDNPNAGKCIPIYNTGVTEDTENYFISHWVLGGGGLKPVINIEKTSLK